MKGRAIVSLTSLALSALFMSSNFTEAKANTLLSSSPTAGAVLVVAPTAVSVTATSTLLADGNQLSVVDPAGKPVDDGNISTTDASVVVGLKSLSATGVYTVSYTLLTQGDQPLTGSFTFLYNAPDQMGQATATPTPSTSKLATTHSSLFNGATIFVLLVFAAGCLVLIFLIWYAKTLAQQRAKKKRKAAKKVTAPSRRRD